MSRIGKREIKIGENVNVEINPSRVIVTGPLGKLEQDYNPIIKIEKDNDVLRVINTNTSKRQKILANALHGTTNSNLMNMIEGVSKGYKKELKIIGVGYRAKLEGNNLILSLGFSHPVKYEIPDLVKIEVPKPTQIFVSGIDKQLVGNVAAIIRDYKKPEPYGGKGIRYIDENVIRKAGKQSK